MATTTIVAGPEANSSHMRARPDPSVRLFNRLAGTCVTLFALIWLVPFVWALITSLRPDDEIAAFPTRPWSSNWNLDAYASAWKSSPLGWWYVNSFIISTLTVIFTVAVCSMAAFALVNLNYKLKYAVYAVILAGLMLPTEALILPQFLEFRALGLLGTYWAIILPGIALPVAVFVFHSFIKGIPVSLIEAARIDGASWWRIYSQICMPLCRPAISAVAILTFITVVERVLVATAGSHPDQIADHSRRTQQSRRRRHHPVCRNHGFRGPGHPAPSCRFLGPATSNRARCCEYRHQVTHGYDVQYAELTAAAAAPLLLATTGFADP